MGGEHATIGGRCSPHVPLIVASIGSPGESGEHRLSSAGPEQDAYLVGHPGDQGPSQGRVVNKLSGRARGFDWVVRSGRVDAAPGLSEVAVLGPSVELSVHGAEDDVAEVPCEFVSGPVAAGGQPAGVEGRVPGGCAVTGECVGHLVKCWAGGAVRLRVRGR